MPSAIAELPRTQARRLEKLRTDYLQRPVSSEAASQAAYGMTLNSLQWRMLERLLRIYSHSPSQVSRIAALGALESAHSKVGRTLKVRLSRELKKRLTSQRNRRLRIWTTLTLEQFAKEG
jgi:hypothetical protein